MIRQLLIASALGFMAPVKKETEPVKASTELSGEQAALAKVKEAEAVIFTLQTQRVEFLAANEKLAATNAELTSKLRLAETSIDNLESANKTLTETIDRARDANAKQAAELSALRSPTSAPPAPPLPRGSDLQEGITEEQVRALIAESLNQLRRADAIRILSRRRKR